jgi:FKBP-type peptidyl-prolyl cis-trans isomerase
VQYTGWLASNGQKFDSSYDHGGQPFALTLGQHQVIPGWEEGLIGMKPGGTRRILIPPALGYGAQGSPPAIPANSTLIFDVTMVSVQ